MNISIEKRDKIIARSDVYLTINDVTYYDRRVIKAEKEYVIIELFDDSIVILDDENSEHTFTQESFKQFFVGIKFLNP